jgi:2-dehydropantoate 2-reductase
MPRSYAIIGTGAVGGYYGAALHHKGHDVHFLLNRDFDHVQRSGLKVEAKTGDLSIPRPNAYRNATDLPACDVVMVCLKTTHNDLLKTILPAAVADGATIVMMQNGLEIEQLAAAAAPEAGAILGGLAFLCSNKLGPGHIQQLDYGQVRLSEYRADDSVAGLTDAVQQVGADLEAANIPIVLEEDLTLARWKKLIWNVPYNGLSVVMGTTTDRLMADPATRELCEALMLEVVAGAAGVGRTIERSFVDQMLEHTEKMVAYKPSMLLDYEGRRPMELEAIYLNTINAARRAGVDLSRIRTLYQQLSDMERQIG